MPYYWPMPTENVFPGTMLEVSTMILLVLLTLDRVASMTVRGVRWFDSFRKNGNPGEPATLGNLTEAMKQHSKCEEESRQAAVKKVTDSFESKLNDLVLTFRSMKVSFNELKERVQELLMKERVREQLIEELRGKIKGAVGGE